MRIFKEVLKLFTMKIRRRKLTVISLVLVIAIGSAAFVSNNERYFEIAKNLDIFATLFKEVNAHYVDEVNPNQLIESGIDAMLSTLDPYTNYIPEDDIENFRTLSTGQYGGIGAQTGRFENRVFVTMVFEGYPAHQAGLKIGDEVIEIDGIDIRPKTKEEVSKLMKGQLNTEVILTVQRYGSNTPIKLPMQRGKIKIDNVPYYGMVTDDIGYLKLTDFTLNAGKEVKEAVEGLKESGAKKIIVDLRGNPGGLLIEAVNISNIFVPKGVEIVSTRGKVSQNNGQYRALNSPIDVEIPLAVLINSGSASASEIVAGSLQDLDRAVLVGQRSFGKGLVQTTRPLSYNSQLKVTTAKYYIPSGRSIQALDYSNRRPDGSVGKIPDSLKVAYKTRNGRTVYDGGGIAPDIEVTNRDLPQVAFAIIRKGLLFEYASKYAHAHESITSAKDFELSDKEYDQFAQWVSTKDYDYTTRVEREMDDLVASAKREKYYDRISKQLDALNTSIESNKKQDLYLHKEEIKILLQEEIVSRYYLEDGAIEVSFSEDHVIQEATKVLNDRSRYLQILSGN